jgi:hypothetical protein
MSDERTYHPWTTVMIAREEARSRGDRRIGTEHLVLGLLPEPGIAEALATDLASARAALAGADEEALAAVGIDAAVGPPPAAPEEPEELPGRPTVKELLTHRLGTTPAAKEALREMGRPLRRKGRPWTAEELMLVLLELRPPDPAAELLDRLGVDRAAARERLRLREAA